jgi:hypothetical protein
MTITTEEAERMAQRLANDAEAPQGARYQPYTDSAMRNAAAALRSLAAERDALKDENARMKEVLERLARLGNEPHYGNSDGNIIARAELERLSRAEEKE